MHVATSALQQTSVGRAPILHDDKQPAAKEGYKQPAAQVECSFKANSLNLYQLRTQFLK
jgi:hypothetical protein